MGPSAALKGAPEAKLHLPLPLSAVVQAQQRQQQRQQQLQHQVQQQLQQQQAVWAPRSNEAQDGESQAPHPHASPSSDGAAKAASLESDPAATSMTVELRRTIFASPGFYALAVHAGSTEQMSELANSMKAAARTADGQTRAETVSKETDAGSLTDTAKNATASGAAVSDKAASGGAEAITFDPVFRELQEQQQARKLQQKQQQQQQQQQQHGTLPHAQAKPANRFTPEVRPDFTVVCRLRGMRQTRMPVLSSLPHRRQRLHVQGRWVLHPRYGMQLEASQICDEGHECELQAGGRKGRGALAVKPIDLLKFKLELSRLKGDTERASHSLSVTDLTAVDWCELQTAYQTASGKPKVATAAMQQGSSMHQALEDAAVGVTIKVPLLNKEEDLAVALLNIISCIRQLAVEGATRELRMMAPVQGQWLVGVVDSLRIEPATGFVSMTETKTRRQPTKPAEEQVRTAKIQVLMYHAMYEAYRNMSLKELHHYLFKVSSNWVGLQPDKLLSPQLSALCAAAGITSGSIHAPAEAAALEQLGRQLLQHLVHIQATPSTQQRQEQQLQQWLQGDVGTRVAGADEAGTEAVGMWGQHQAVGSLRMGDEAERMDQHQIDEVGGTGGRQEGVGVVEHQGVVDQQQTQVGLDERRKQKQKERRQRRKQRARKEREERENQLEKKVAGGAGQQEPEEQQVPAKLQGQQQHSKQPASYILQAPPPPLQQQQRQQQQSECLQGLQQDAGAQLRTGVQHSSLQQNIRQGRSQGVQQQSDTQQHEALWPALSGAQLQGQLPLGDVVQALHQSLQLLPGLGSTHGLEYLSLDGQCISREEVVFDQRWLQSRLDTALGVWTGRAAPRPVDEDWKCSNCLFKPSCWKYQPQDPLSQPSSLADQTLKAAAKAGCSSQSAS